MRKIEVDELHASVQREHEILELHVAVHDAARVAVLEGQDYIGKRSVVRACTPGEVVPKTSEATCIHISSQFNRGRRTVSWYFVLLIFMNYCSQCYVEKMTR